MQNVIEFYYNCRSDMYPVTEWSLPSFSSGGAYPMAYYTKAGDSLCGDCATDDVREYLATDEWTCGAIWGYEAVEECDYDIRCDECSTVICEGYMEENYV